jgi:hypothetical protein
VPLRESTRHELDPDPAAAGRQLQRLLARLRAARSFPDAPNASFVPAHDAPKEVLQTLHERFGIDRCVVVQSS